MAAKKTSAKKKASTKPAKKALAKTKKPAKKAPPKAKKAPAKKAGKKAAAKRVVPKRSPLRGTTVEAYLDALIGWQRAIAARLHRLVHAASPHITSSIKWAQPVYEHNGPLAYFKPAAKHVTFGFWRGAELDDPGGVLEGGSRMKHVKVTSDGNLDEGMLTRFVMHAVRLNSEKGDPTKR